MKFGRLYCTVGTLMYTSTHYVVHGYISFEEKLSLDVGAAAGGDSSASTLLSPVTPAEVKQKILYNLKGIVTV